MRVVSGSARGIPLRSVPGDTTRPILDRVKTALFDILRPKIAGARVLDMFAGSGSVGIEALSQGAEHCVFLDIEPKAVKTIRENLEATRLAAQAEVRQTDAFKYVRNTQKSFSLIFIAPPQYKGLWVEALQTIAERPERVASGGIIVVQIDPREYEEQNLSAFEKVDEREYGNSALILYSRH